MKRFLNTICVLLFITCACIFVGCNDRFAGLRMSLSFSFSPESENVELLDDGTYRVTTAGGVFDARVDGSYVIYIGNDSARIPLDIVYSNTPSDFNYDVSFAYNSDAVRVDESDTEHISNGIRVAVVASSEGQGYLVARNSESGITSSIYIEVVKVSESISFRRDSLALSKEERTSIDFTNEVIGIPANQDFTLEFGTGSADNFETMSSDTLRTEGFSYNPNTKILSLTRTTNINLSSLTVKATYDSPLGEKLTAFSTIRILSSLTNFEVYVGTSIDDVIEENKLSQDSLLEFVYNMGNGLSYKDLILKVNSNGEKIEFGVIQDSLYPFLYPTTQPRYDSEYYYYDDAGFQVDSYEEASVTYAFIRLQSNKKTDGVGYENDIYNLVFTCNYADYEVINYPINTSVPTTVYSLIQSFEINGNNIPHFTFEEGDLQSIIEAWRGSFYTSNLYLNTSADLLGEKFEIDVAEPSNVKAEDAKYFVEFYDGELNRLLTPGSYFAITYEYEGTRLLTDSDFENTFDKNGVFYVKPNETVEVNSEFYMVFRAEKPDSGATTAVIWFKTVQGISEVTSYDFINYTYEVDEEGNYVLDKFGNKVTTNTGSQDVNFTVSETSSKTFIGNEDINIDLNVGRQVTVNLETENLETDYPAFDFLTISSSNVNVARVINNGNGEFFIEPVSSGSSVITITAPNLSTVYKINVNVFSPISVFYVTMSVATYDKGVGEHVLADDNTSTKSAVVEAQRTFNFIMSTRPLDQLQFDLQTYVYFDENDNGIIDEEGGENPDTLVPSLGGLNSYIYQDGYFSFDTRNLSFSFLNDNGTDRTYILRFEIHNLDGAILTKDVVLNSYVPIRNVFVESSTPQIFKSNAIYYENKVLDSDALALSKDDPSIFGVKVSTNINSNRIPTFSFNNYGVIELEISGVLENRYRVENGVLVLEYSRTDTPITLLSNLANDGYYWFRLSESYNGQNEDILVSAYVREFNRASYENNVMVNILNVNEVGTISSLDGFDINFRQGIDDSSSIDLEISGNNIFNDNLLYRFIAVSNVNGVNKFIVPQEDSGLYTLDMIKTYENNFRLDFTLSRHYKGMGVIIILPQDKINNINEYNLWFENPTYEEYDVTQENFIAGLYYVLQGNEYVPVTEYAEDAVYYVRTVDFSNLLSIWDGALILNISISDGVDVPYHISTYEELLEIGASVDAVSKNYVLTRDIEIPTGESFNTIANYYLANVNSEEEFLKDTYYTLDESGNYVLSDAYIEDTIYYGYGFNGTLTGKYVLYDYKTGKEIVQYYGISNVRFVGNNTRDLVGIFSKLGVNGSITDLTIEYSYYQPTTSVSGAFGGVVGENRGTINNVNVRFTDYRITTTNNDSEDFVVSVGGIAGRNYGVIENNTTIDSVNMEGTINVVMGGENQNIYVGGFVGSNYGSVFGSYNTSDQASYTFNDIGFDSSLNIRVTGASSNTRIGGVVGYNMGGIGNLAVQGEVIAPNCDNVGGLVGYNTSGSFEYSIERSFMSGKTQGRNYVGGAVGQALQGSYYNISAENYATFSNSSRTFVRGENYVGGLIGYASGANIEFSYVVSYFNSDSLSEDVANLDSSYDVVGNNNVGGFIGMAANSCIIKNSASYLNVKGVGAVSNFISFDNNTTISNSFTIGCIYGEGSINTNPISTRTNSYSIIYNALTGESFVNGMKNGTIDSISVSGSPWQESGEENTPPYLVFEGEALISTSQIVITVMVNDNAGDYVNYIKASNSALLLFYGLDEFNSYSSSIMSEVNTIKLNDIISLGVEIETNKTTRFDVRSSDSSVLMVSPSGDIRVVGLGNAIITISSKLNSNISAQLEVVVTEGITGFEVYANPSLTANINNSTLELVKSQTQTLYSESEYIRNVNGQNVGLMSYDNVGLRFIIEDDEKLEKLFDSLELESIDRDLNDILRIEGMVWGIGDGYYYVDVDNSASIFIEPLMAFSEKLNISYIPYIEANFNNEVIRVLLDQIGERTFSVTASYGATDIIIENNILSTVEINQLEYFSFTVTVKTDFDGEDIDNNVDLISDDNFGFNEGNKVFNYDNLGNVVSVSRTYTVWYKDKETALSSEKRYKLSFWPNTNTSENKIDLTIIVHGQDGVSDISARIYSDIKTDFPQHPSDSNTIYNGRTALFAFEVYPYFANYSKLRISYTSSANYSFTLSQLRYNNSGTGDKFTVYTNSGAIFDENGALIVQKTSGQDSASISSNGIYSYSRMYFFGVLIPSNVPDRTAYTMTIDVLDSRDNVILSKSIEFTTLARSDLNLSFNEEYLGEDTIYYLPANTRQELNINTTNDYETISFEVTSSDYELTESMKEMFTPLLEGDKYYVNIMDYENNLFTTDLIGKTINITATVDGGETTDPCTVSFVISLFTVTDISASGVSQGYMILQNSVTTPLKVTVSASFDESVLGTTNNWYNEWYLNFGTDETNSLYQQIVNAGYEVQENFISYISILEEQITKADYDSDAEGEKVSGVWLYVDSNGTLSVLRNGRMYNNNAFGVEDYRGYIAVYGYETDRNSSLRLNVRLSYAHFDDTTSRVKDSSGIANVRDYNFEHSLYQGSFTFIDEFMLAFVDRVGINNPVPVSSASEFLSLANEEGGDFRLVNDIELTNYTPFDINVNSFDGNNYKIYITSFAEVTEESTVANLGLFNEIGQDTMIYNTAVYYTNRVDLSIETGRLVPRAYPLTYTAKTNIPVNFGGIAVTNNGIITNCTTSGSVTLNISNTNMDVILNGGLVATNSENAFITNSKVVDFMLTCYGRTGGFVGINSGKIVASYFDNSSISNLSTANVGGFVYQNDGVIYECFSQGARNSTDNDIRNTGAGITSDGGNVGGFVYQNNNLISDCYSNILISTSSIMAGFVYLDSASSEISKSYSISYKRVGDNETTAFPFLGPSTEFTPLRVVVNGILNNCYYLTTGGTWANSNFYLPNSNNPRETPASRRAFPLETDDFATHDSFINYDLSLVYNTDRYADNRTEFNYIDGYTWVIVGGKPLLVSTLTNTISQQDYLGKEKNYESEDIVYFDLASLGELHVEEQRVGIGSSEIITNYYQVDSNGNYTEEDLIFSTLRNNNTNTLTYNFMARNGLNSLSIICNIVTNEEGDESIEFDSAEYGDGTILDIRTNVGDVYYDTDENFRANDTIIIERNEETNEILRITYRELQSASYYYSASVTGVSDIVGSRTNPKIIYDYESFSYWLTETTTNKTNNSFFRLVSDIDLNNNFVSTSRSTFKGILQGNYMTIDNLSISYFNTSVIDENLNSTSFGLFASIETDRDSSLDTVISNLNINVNQVLSNAHRFVGALAGEIRADERVNSHKVFLANIKIGSTIGASAYIMGRNAVGGLAGIATGYVIIKDITTSVSVNASYDAPSSIINSTLYIDRDDTYISRVSYAGGVVGIFDVKKVVDTATLRNYNANNVTVSNDNSYVGNIVGSAFGLVGENSIVNYTNAYLSHSETSFIKATSYGGGLVGENRGTIISSSSNYLEDSSNNDGIGESSYSEFDLFFSGLGGEVNSIGGLVGLNNGGLITNSISNVNVRNELAVIAGGAVGRMLEGALVNVVATGSVLSNKIMGGFIGSMNNISLLVEEGNYDINTLINFDISKYTDFYGSFAESENKNVIISSCVSANNWLVEDYSYYSSKLLTESVLSGFIGVISYYDENLNRDIFEDMAYIRPSYYANTLYTTVNGSNPARYLQSTYISVGLDEVEVNEDSPNILVDSNNEQVVFPYSTSEFYYESMPAKVTYAVRSENNISGSMGGEHDVYADVFYRIESSTPSDLINNDNLYTLVDYNKDGSWNTPYEQRSYQWYQARFGYIYYKDESGQYILVNGSSDFESLEKIDENTYRDFYYIASPILNSFTFTEEYSSSEDDIFIYGNNSAQSTRVNGYTFESIDDLKAQNYISVNGLRIPIDLSDETNSRVDEVYADEEHEIFVSGEYEYSNFRLPLQNGGEVTNIKFTVSSYSSANNIRAYIENVELTFEYNNIGYENLDGENVFVSLNSYRGDVNTITNFELVISSKKVIYSSYRNGYWEMDENFLLDNLDEVTRYPVNLELAEKYVWSDFRSNSVSTEIYTAEDLAAFAYMVNSGLDSYENKEVTLHSDVDLSGKYWVPIGSEEHPFKGTFNGNGHSIKYVSVNENSIKDGDGLTLPKYAGLFGMTDGATIKDLSILGGEVSGEYAGGLVARAENTEIYNITNRNNSLGVTYSGGIVGLMNSGSIYNTYNYARVESTNSSTRVSSNVYIGGIVGNAKNVVFSYLDADSSGQLLSNTNYGEIYTFNTLNNYISNRLINLYAGGIIGHAENMVDFEGAFNEGDISITTNSNKIYVGGIVGYVTSPLMGDSISFTSNYVQSLKNNGNIDITNSNTFSSVDLTEDSVYEDYATCDIGGVFGYADLSASLISNEGDIVVNAISSSEAKMSIGGLIGRLDIIRRGNESDQSVVGGVRISSSYNIGNVEVYSTNGSTFGIGGLIGVSDLTYYITNNSDEGNEKTKDKVHIYDSYNAGEILSSNNCETFLGGVLGYAYGTNEVSNRVLIERCLNVGSLTIYNIMRARNALGAIAGVDNFIFTTNPNANTNVTVDDIDSYVPESLYNFYLRGSAYSQGINYTAFTEYEASTSNYTPVEDISTFALSRISSTLKSENNYELEIVIDDTSYVIDVWDFENVWQRQYDTWYPTLRNNLATSFWVDRVTEVQSTGVSYSVSSEKELAYIAKQINSGEIESEGIIINLTAPLDLSNKFWTPIGSEEYPFKGTFNGNMYEIKNLTVDGSFMTNSEYGGLFGVVQNATIRNVGLSSPVIKNVSTAGGVVAKANNSLITMVYTENEESEDSIIEGMYSSGGIVGELTSSAELESNRKGLYFAYNNTRVGVNSENTGSSSIGGLVGVLESSYIGNAYNSENGIITVRDDSVEDGASVVGSTVISSRLLNVFNLSSVMMTSDNNSIEISGKTMYYITTNETGEVVLKNSDNPTFDNLSNNDDSNKYLGDPANIWTKEYSLNSVELSEYPTLRGLGREWKNVESETLTSFSISSNFSERNSILDYVDSITSTKLEDGSSVIKEIDKTLVSFSSESFSGVSVNTIYLITSEEELVWLANNVNSGNLLTSNTEFVLLKDLDLSGSYWTPIGVSAVYPFSGVFNFNGHVIKGLTIDNSSYIYAGLFGYTKNAYIVNGYVDNAFIKITNESLNSESYVGTLVGFGDNTTIRNMSVSTSISSYSTSASFIGGIAGYLKGTNYSVRNVNVSGANAIDLGGFKDCVVEVEDNTEVLEDNIHLAGFSNEGRIFAGGVVGYIVGPEEQESDFSVIDYAVSSINIAAVSKSSSSNVYAGGVVGYAAEYLTINAVSSSSVVKTYSSKFDIAGGIVGFSNDGVISNSLFTGYLESRYPEGRDDSTSQIWSYVGGIVGSTRGGMVTNCVMKGRTLSSGYSIGAIIGYAIDLDYSLYNTNTGEDRSLYYADRGFNGADPVAVHRFESLTEPENLPELASQIFVDDVTSVSGDDSPFIDTYWTIDGGEFSLRSDKIFVIGAGEESFTASYENETKPLLSTGQGTVESAPGLYVDTEGLGDVELAVVQGEDVSIGIAVVIEDASGNLTYNYIESPLADIQGTGETFDLSKCLGGVKTEDIVVCFITLIE